MALTGGGWDSIIRTVSKNRTKRLEDLAEKFKALASPHRLRIFLRLVDCCCGRVAKCAPDQLGACVGELGSDLGLAASTVSHHIKELRRAGLISVQRRGQNVACRVDDAALRGLADFFAKPPRA